MLPLAGRSLWVALALLSPSLADDPPAPDSPLVRLLKKAPPERQGPIVSRLGQIGLPTDLAYLLDQATRPDGFTPPIRLKALEALTDATVTRKVVPNGHLASLERLLLQEKADPATRLAAIRLAGLWKVEAMAEGLCTLAELKETGAPARAAMIDALAAMGDAGRPAVRAFTAPERPRYLRNPAVAALATYDPESAAPKAVELIRTAEKGQDFVPLMAAFLNRKGGADLLAGAISGQTIPADNAKLALRAVYALGHADPTLIAALSKAAGISSDVQPPTKEEMDRLIADVAAHGDAARGERIFRRADLNCMKCHAISGAAGGVGPDLSSVGLTSPPDYVINSILLPDQAIKEQYHTLVVATNDGQVYSGIVADKDEKKVVLREATGDLRTVPTAEIDETKPGGSLMPKGLANLLTRDEFLDLVRFVSELGKPGPYAIHATPTVQRWRLMKPVPQELAKGVPDEGTFISKVRDSDASNWVPAYALSTGELPLDEFSRLAESRVLYLRGEIDVTAAGAITVDLGSAHGVTAWLDDSGTPHRDRSFTWDVTPGRHTITLQVDTTAQDVGPVTVKVAKSPGSSAEFTIVGGR